MVLFYSLFIIVILFASACQTGQPTDTLASSTPSEAATYTQTRFVTSITTPTETQPPTDTPVPTQTPTATVPAPTAVPTKGKTIVVNSNSDSGPGTLRQALLDAGSGDSITFDLGVFLPTAPATIHLVKSLPHISQGDLTIDASNAGVILDGSGVSEDWASGIEIVSDRNTIHGLQVVNFSGTGIAVSGGAQNNVIGGDRRIGTGPFGQGNLAVRNDIGIGLWGNGTSFNIVRGNLIGTDDSGEDELGNHGHGIMILEGASRNVIGPANVISGNGGDGVSIGHSDSVGNTITQNKISGNNQMGISLNDGSNSGLGAPVIFDFNLEAGTIAGTACANCLVEIFSSSDDEGKHYEGWTTADALGGFTFSKEASFTEFHLTTTATNADGNTSNFSIPTSGISKYSILQEGNDLPKTLLYPKRSKELADNRIGSVGLDDGPSPSGELTDLQAVVDEVVNMGLKSIRFTITRIDGDRVDWDKPEFIFEPRHYDFITSMAKNSVLVQYLLIFRDDALGGEGRSYHERFKTEEEILRYLDYVRFIISNVKGLVPYYEIWNEPNIGDSVQWIEVEDYINLVRRVVPVIHQEDPQAKIMLAGTTYLREPESREYLFNILSSDIMPLVDVVTWHPMYAASPEFHSEYYYEYPAIVQHIKDTASTHGFTGEYVAGEIAWWTKPESEAQEWGIWYSDIAAAKYHARGNVMHLGMDVRVTNASVPSGLPSRQLADKVITNICTIMAGAEATNLPFKVDIEATNVMSYSFSLSNGDYLIALWTDGVAVDDDPGVPATLTIPNISAGKVMGIDVLHGFEQELIATTENGNLVIQDLLVKDYPLILRLSE